MVHNPLNYARGSEKNNALRDAQTQIRGNIINSQGDEENSPILRIHYGSHTVGITDQVIADRYPESINHTKPESPKETITIDQNPFDYTFCNALQIVQPTTKEYIINNQEGLIMEWWRFGGVFINQEQSGITDTVIVYLNHSIPYIVGFAKNLSFVDGLKDAAMSFVDGLKDAAMSFVDGLKDAAMDIFELEKKMPIVDVRKDVEIFSREREKEIVKKNNNKNLERSFVDVRKDADMDIFELEEKIVVSPDVGTKIENRKYKFIKPINCMTDFHARSLQIRKIMEIERYNRDAVDAPKMYNRDAVDAPKIFSLYLPSEMSTKIYDILTQNETNLLNKFGNPDATVVIKLSKFSKTYKLKTQLKAFVQDAVRTSEPVTIEMLRSAASLAGLEIEELFLRNSNNQSIRTEDLTYVIYFPDDCRYFIFIPAVRDCDSKLKNKTAVVAEQQRQLKN